MARATERASSRPRSSSTIARGEVEAGGHARRSPDPLVGHEDAVLVDEGVWEAPGELARRHPVGGGAAAPQQAGLGQDEGAGADRADPTRGGSGDAEQVSISGEVSGRSMLTQTISVS